MADSTVDVRDVRRKGPATEDDADQLRPARGVAWGCVIGAGIWAGLLALAKG